jgi:WD40 repeat protein
MAKGSCMLVVKQHSAEVTSAVWLPDGERIITGSHDKNMVRTRTSPCNQVQMPLTLQNSGQLMAWKRRVVQWAFIESPGL